MTQRTGHSTRRLAALVFGFLLIIAALPGTNWTLAPVDSALTADGYALVAVRHGTAAAVAAKANAAGATDVAALETLDLVTARVSARSTDTLRSDVRVAYIASDARVAALGMRSADYTTTSSAGILAIDTQRAWSLSTGKGVTVALMDTGVAGHPDLGGTVLARIDFVNDGATKYDPSGHGTFVAGLIAAHGSTFQGVAPDAKLVSLRVLGDDGTGTLHSVLAAFDWLLRNRAAYGIGVLNLSFGAPQTSSYHRELLAAAVESAWFAGVAVVVAAGNAGPVPGSVAMPGADPFVITAGSLNDNGTTAPGDDSESVFSGRGPTGDGFAKPDVLAPGERVVSLRVPGTDGDSLYRRLTGTSASSGFTAGVAALVRSLHPEYSPTQVKGAIVGGGHKVVGSATPALDASDALKGKLAKVNDGLVPSALLLEQLTATGAYDGTTTWGGISWEGVSWEAISWEAISWEAISWEGITWESVSWDSVTWESVGGMAP